MHRIYHDILRNVPTAPLWWFEGVPRYEPFSPNLVGTHEAALVHTECQECRFRYDVAMVPESPLFHSLRDILAYTNSLEVGDPPFACREMGRQCWAGYSMGSLEIRVLEFWHRRSVRCEWEREASLERLLVDGESGVGSDVGALKPVQSRIYDSEKKDLWALARKEGNFPAMVEILTRFGCERPVEVANMLDLNRRFELNRRELWALKAERQS